MRVSQVVKGEMSAKTTYQKSAKGPVSIAECAADGKSVTLENVGRKVRLRRTYLILPLFANMWQGLCNGMLSVRLSARLSVPSIDRCSSVRGFAAVGPAGRRYDRQRRPPCSIVFGSKCEQCHVVSWRRKRSLSITLMVRVV